MVKNSPANAGDIGDAGSTPGSRRSPGGEYTCWRIPWTEGPGSREVEHS